MYDLDLFVIAIYCLIADELYPALCRQYGPPRRAGFAPALSDPECLTLEVVGQYLGYAKQEDLYEQMRRQYGAWFPALPDRVAFVRQSANLWQIKAWLHRRLVTLLGGDHAPVQIIDTVPVPICKLARRWRRKIFRTEPVLEFPSPTKGYCAAKAEEYFGFKGGLRITEYGLIVQADLLQAYGHDSQCRPALLAGIRPGTTVIGDSAFLDLEEQQTLQAQADVALLTPVKRNMHVEDARKPFVLPSWAHPVRRLIETVQAQLVDRFHITTMRARDAWHLLNLWLTKILAHTICVFLNIRLHRDPLDFDGLVGY